MIHSRFVTLFVCNWASLIELLWIPNTKATPILFGQCYHLTSIELWSAFLDPQPKLSTLTSKSHYCKPRLDPNTQITLSQTPSHPWNPVKLTSRPQDILKTLPNICLANNSVYKWTKILSLEIDIFHLKMLVKSCLEFSFWDSASSFRVAATQCKKICP